jgi:hypothetical protein
LVGGRGDVLHLKGVEEVLRLGDTASQGISRGALALPSEGDYANPLLSCGKQHGDELVETVVGAERRLVDVAGEHPHLMRTPVGKDATWAVAQL